MFRTSKLVSGDAEMARKNAIKAYAQSLSAFTSAPPNLPDLSLPGQPTSPPFPPFLNEEKICRGYFDSEESLGPLGETRSVGRRKCLYSLH